MDPDIRERLAALDEPFRNAQAAGSSDMPPAGDYQAMVDRFDVFNAKTNGRLWLRTELTIASGQHKGWDITILNDLEDPGKLKYLKAHLAALDVEVESLALLEDALRTALDAVVEVTIYTTGDRSFAKVTRRHTGVNRSDIPADPLPQTVPVADGDADDTLPF